jgi:hypothetical protein
MDGDFLFWIFIAFILFGSSGAMGAAFFGVVDDD